MPKQTDKQKNYTQYTSHSNSKKSKTKKKILERSSGGPFIYREAKTRIIPTSPQKTRRKRTEQSTLKCWENVTHQSRIRCSRNYPSKLREKEKLSNKQKLREFVTSRPDCQEMSKILQREEKLYWSETQIYMKKGRALEKE